MTEEWGAGVAWRFVDTDDGGVGVVLEPPYPLIDEALVDAVGQWALVGGDEILSTYGVDELIDRLESDSGPAGEEQLLAEGDTSQLIKLDGYLLARDTIFEVPDDKLAVVQALRALRAWREEMLMRGASSLPPES